MSSLSNSHHTIDDIKYHSPDNQNIINWLPFCKTDNILIINSKSTSIINYFHQITNQVDTTNNISQVNSSKKYDYIFLENVTEGHPLFDIILFSLKHLKTSGIILFPFTNIVGIDSLISSPNPNSYNKQSISQIAQKLNLHIFFYNVFPNHFIPEIIFSDDFLRKNQELTYAPLNLNNTVVTQNEIPLFNNLVKTNDILDHSNSYFALISPSQIIKTKFPTFLKFNNYRKPKYNLTTYFKNNRYYKKPNYPESQSFIKEITINHQELKSLGFSIPKFGSENNQFYSNLQSGDSFIHQLRVAYRENPEECVKKISEFWQEIIAKYHILSHSPTNNIFQKYHIEINSGQNQKLHYVKKLYIDMIPQNVIVDNNIFYFYDQEWSIKNAPLEFLLYRILSHTAVNLYRVSYQTALDYFIVKFQLDEVSDKFKLLENCFLDSVRNDWYQYYKPYQNPINVIEQSQQLNSQKDIIKKYESTIENLEQTVNIQNQNLHNFLNSTSWKITKPFRCFSKKLNHLK